MDDHLKKRIFSLLDLTSLNTDDDAAKIEALCEKACGALGKVAAVCVYPEWIGETKHQLSSSIPIATVANFPSGNEALDEILLTIEQALMTGASEIDLVFPYRDYLHGDKAGALQIVAACRTATAGRALLKVILETGVLSNLSVIEEVSLQLIDLQVDFLKTSTGKVSVGATIEAASTMLQAIKSTGGTVGFKASGGIRTFEQALIYLRLAEDVMGADWVTSERFRIGTSGL